MQAYPHDHKEGGGSCCNDSGVPVGKPYSRVLCKSVFSPTVLSHGYNSLHRYVNTHGHHNFLTVFFWDWSVLALLLKRYRL